jgi:hypothetical protein
MACFKVFTSTYPLLAVSVPAVPPGTPTKIFGLIELAPDPAAAAAFTLKLLFDSALFFEANVNH